jgi:hypothetical protein
MTFTVREAVINVPVSDGFDYPIGNKQRYTLFNDGDAWYVALNFDEEVPDPNYSGGRKWHLGEDWNVEKQTACAGTSPADGEACGPDTDLYMPVYAISNGAVVYADTATGWGNLLIIRHMLPDGITFVESLYDISGPVIPAFVNVPAPDTLRPLAARADRALVLSWKTPESVSRRFQADWRKAAPNAATAVDVLPVVPQDTLAAEMRASRYFVSLATYEGFGLPMLEAMANGCAAVGLASGGNSEYARDGENCRLCRYPRLDDLAQALARLGSQGDEAGRLAAAGRATAENFGYRQFEARWKDLFEQIL